MLVIAALGFPRRKTTQLKCLVANVEPLEVNAYLENVAA